MEKGTAYIVPETLQETFERTYKVQINAHFQHEYVENGDGKFLRELVDYIEQNMSNGNLSVEKLGCEMKMSRVWLYKKLLMLTGKSPVEFIRAVRLKKAIELLENTEMRIGEIASEVGLETPQYFSKLFKKEYDMLPSVYVYFTRKAKAQAMLNAYGLQSTIKIVSFNDEAGE